MCMPLERRVHILLDEARYQRIAAAAKERNSSVGAVIRDAIDKAVPAESARRRAAAERILSMPPVPMPGPQELKGELEEIRGGAL
jgi:hypothetical protein